METLGTLAGGIAHDFNNLLMIMLGHTEIATEMLPDDHRVLGVLQNVRKAGMRATELVRRIMAFGRVSEQPRQAVILSHVVGESLPLLRASLPTTIEIDAQLETGERTVLADPTQLQQVLFNLCVNASQAMQDMNGRLVIKLTDTTISTPRTAMVGTLNPGKYLCVSVADNGSGMTPEVLARAFEPFFTTKTMGNGTGLGLSIVHSIVTGHGGAVQMQSKPRKGTTVSVYLPEVVQAKKNPSASPWPEVSRRSHSASPIDGAKKAEKMLAVVDDEESIALLTKQALDNNGFKSIAFTSAQDCLEHIVNHPDEIALVVTDQIMPKITGSELVRRLRTQGILIPAIIVSGISRPVGASELKQLAPIDFLSKPFEFAQLLHVIGQLLPKRK